MNAFGTVAVRVHACLALTLGALTASETEEISHAQGQQLHHEHSAAASSVLRTHTYFYIRI